MKKLVTLLLSLALVLSLAACGGEATPDASDDAPASSQNEESTENDNTENQIVFEEVVAIDNAECAVKITEIDPDNMWGYTLKAQLENKSTEKTYMFSVESASINGVQCDPMFASEVAAGKKANEEINFSTDTLEENGIVEYTDIELTFKVYDSNDWSADPVGKETIHVYPYGEENAVAFVREAQATDNVIIDKGGGIVAGVFYLLGGLLGIVNYGSFSDLAIWSVLCFIFGAVFILGSLKMKKADKSNTDAAE